MWPESFANFCIRRNTLLGRPCSEKAFANHSGQPHSTVTSNGRSGEPEFKPGQHTQALWSPLTRFESDGQLFWVIVPCNTCIRMTPDISTERLGIIDRGLAPTFAHQCNCIRDLATDASRQIHMGPTWRHVISIIIEVTPDQVKGVIDRAP